ncbi:MAG TPA: DUF1080 domain-containing protein [Gemmatimonadaceae bacterium]|nr:DUF1080 domain-containing protein [Gemmatimonadaceae bacterium]
MTRFRASPAAAYLTAAALLSAGCSSSPRGVPVNGAVATAAAAPGAAADGGWRSLFDGRTTAGWRGYRSDSMPAGWHVVDGALVREATAGDIVTAETFRNFELSLQWKISPGGNSGIMYRVTEDQEHPYETGPEMQVLDDQRHRDGRSRLTSSGALYGLYPAPEGAVKPVGEWNSARILVDGTHVEHWLNGVKMADAEIGSADWNARVAASKFRQWPGYAKAASGHIALQDHGDWVAFRDIRVRVLP